MRGEEKESDRVDGIGPDMSRESYYKSFATAIVGPSSPLRRPLGNPDAGGAVTIESGLCLALAPAYHWAAGVGCCLFFFFLGSFCCGFCFLAFVVLFFFFRFV